MINLGRGKLELGRDVPAAGGHCQGPASARQSTKDLTRSGNRGESTRSRSELLLKKAKELPLGCQDFVAGRGAVPVAIKQPFQDARVGHVRSVGPIDLSCGQVENSGHRPEKTLVINVVRLGEGAIDIEYGEAQGG